MPAGLATWSDPAFRRVMELLGAHAGLAFTDSRVPDAEAGVRRALAHARVESLPAYVQRLERGQADLDDLVAELTVGETYFLRDPQQFQVIREEILPRLARERPPDHVLRLWSAGCASGEEAHSLAIVLEQAGLAARADILATDICRPALARAAEGSYGAWSLRGVDPSVIQRYFRADGQRTRVDDRLRPLVRFAYLNLARDDYPSFANGTWRMDLILCRNVLIYLHPTIARSVATRLAACLAPGGWLVTAPADPEVNEDGALEAVVTGAGLVYRRASGVETTAAGPRGVRIEPPAPDSSRPAPLDAARSPSPLPRTEDRDPRPAPSAPPPPDPLVQARDAFARGDYPAAASLSEPLLTPEAQALCIRALANGGEPGAALRQAAEATARHPGTGELHLLHAVLLIDLHRYPEAARAARRAIYLDRTLTMGHFLLGEALVRQGDAAGASKAFRNARDLCTRQAPEEPVRFADGQRASAIARAAAAELERLAAGVPS